MHSDDISQMRDLFQTVQRVAAGEQRELYVVGGFVRDALAGRPSGSASSVPRNVDLAIARDAVAFAQRLAQRLSGTFVLLHEEFGSARVVLPDGVELDMTDFRAETLEADLRARDFTINAMAVPLERLASAFGAGELGDAAGKHVAGDAGDWQSSMIDPLGGRRDLAQRRLRLCHEGALRDDPVRIIRGIALIAQYELDLLPDTARAMQTDAGALAGEPAERVMEPLWKLLSAPKSVEGFVRMDALGILDVLLPELTHGRGVTQGGYHHLDVLQHQFEALRELESLLASPDCSPDGLPELPLYLRESVSGRPRTSLMKLGALCHDIGKPFSRTVDEEGRVWFKGHEVIGSRMARDMAGRLKLSNKQEEALTLYVRHHLRPGQLARLRREAAGGEPDAAPQPTPRALYRFFRDTRGEGVATSLVWLADRSATRGPESEEASLPEDRAFVLELVELAFRREAEIVHPKRLVTGTALMERLGIGPGPLVGELLEAIAEAQVEGEVGTEEEALAFAVSLFEARQRTGEGEHDE